MECGLCWRDLCSSALILCEFVLKCVRGLIVLCCGGVYVCGCGCH
jgi:hypothetical protein